MPNTYLSWSPCTLTLPPQFHLHCYPLNFTLTRYLFLVTSSSTEGEGEDNQALVNNQQDNPASSHVNPAYMQGGAADTPQKDMELKEVKQSSGSGAVEPAGVASEQAGEAKAETGAPEQNGDAKKETTTT